MAESSPERASERVRPGSPVDLVMRGERDIEWLADIYRCDEGAIDHTITCEQFVERMLEAERAYQQRAQSH